MRGSQNPPRVISGDRADDHKTDITPADVIEPEGLPKSGAKATVTAETAAAVERARLRERRTRDEIERLTAEKERRDREAAEEEALQYPQGDTVPGALEIMTKLQGETQDGRYRAKREKAFHLTADEARALRETDAALDRAFRLRVAGVKDEEPPPAWSPSTPRRRKIGFVRGVRRPQPRCRRRRLPIDVPGKSTGGASRTAVLIAALATLGAAAVLFFGRLTVPKLAVCDTTAVKNAALTVFLKDPATYARLRTDWDAVLAEGLAAVAGEDGGLIVPASAVLAAGENAADVTERVTEAVLAAARGDAR